MIECPGCGNAVNINSKKCPTCGANVKKIYEERSGALFFGCIVIAIVSVFSVFVYGLLLDYPFKYIERMFSGNEYADGTWVNIYYTTGISLFIALALFGISKFFKDKRKYVYNIFVYLSVVSFAIMGILFTGIVGKFVSFLWDEFTS